MKMTLKPKNMKYLFLLIATSLIFQASAQFQIGHTTITFNDPSRTGGFGSGGGTGRQIQTEIYYPATSVGTDVTAAAGQFPVIVFGHGFAMSWDAYQNIWEHYVQLGYILAFPRTEGSLIPSPNHGEFALDLRLVEQRMQAQNSVSSSLLYQKIHPNSAIIGHSMGGGATILAGANNTSIKTIVGLAPAETTPSAISAAVNVTVPSLIFSGGQDGVTPAADHHIPIYTNLGSDCKSFVNVVGGAHCYFANTNFNCDFGESTSSTGISITRAEQQTRTFSLLDPWLEYTLKENCAAYTTFLNLSVATPSQLLTQSTCVANPIPVINEASGVLTSSTTGISYQWFLNGNEILGANSISYTPQVNGDYYVEVTSENNCPEISLPFTVNGLAVDEIPQFVYNLYPNPTSGFVHITNTSTEKIPTEIYTLSGMLVSKQEVSTSIDLNGLESGIYFIKINNVNYRIIKE